MGCTVSAPALEEVLKKQQQQQQQRKLQKPKPTPTFTLPHSSEPDPDPDRFLTCIVNDGHLNGQDTTEGRSNGGGVCGRPAARNRECAPPVCAEHLCQHLPWPTSTTKHNDKNGNYKSSSKARCSKTPLRLARGTLYNAAGWFPDAGGSAYCAEHEERRE